ncbi:MAG: metallopeptidase family protein [Ignavibacteriales bacterium]|nr:metallopeptidase family protein [Ignavibacteriales bacterium]
MQMSRREFEDCAQEAFDALPRVFQEKIENVQIVFEDFPSPSLASQLRSDRRSLLGLYSGIPLPHRNTWYGASPTVPDTIYLFQKNIEAQCSSKEELRERITEVLLHELGHYFGMNEEEVRRALNELE